MAQAAFVGVAGCCADCGRMEVMTISGWLRRGSGGGCCAGAVEDGTARALEQLLPPAVNREASQGPGVEEEAPGGGPSVEQNAAAGDGLLLECRREGARAGQSRRARSSDPCCSPCKSGGAVPDFAHNTMDDASDADGVQMDCAITNWPNRSCKWLNFSMSSPGPRKA